MAVGSGASGTTAEATLEPGEPTVVGPEQTGSVWYSVTPAASGPLTIDVCDASFDTTLGVYMGSSTLARLNEVVYNDDSCGDGGPASQVSFNAGGGTTYLVAVAGVAETGDFTPRVAAGAPPAEPLACPPTGVTPGAVYRGTHEAGGAACLTVSSDFKSVTSFSLSNVPAGWCPPISVQAIFAPPLAIADRTIVDPMRQLVGWFNNPQTVAGWLAGDVGDGCSLPHVTWNATTDAATPWLLLPLAPSAPPAAPPAPAAGRVRLRLSIDRAKVQRPLRRNGVTVTMMCNHPCAARVSGAVRIRPSGRIALRSVRAQLTAGFPTTLKLTLGTAARRTLATALRRGRAATAKVKVRVTTAAGDIATAEQTIRLRR